MTKENNNLTKILIIIIIGLILIIGGICFFNKDKLFGKSTTKTEEKKYTEETKLSKEEIQNLYDSIPILNSDIEYKNAYQSNKVTKDGIDNRLLLSIAFKKTENEIKDTDKIGWCPEENNEYKDCEEIAWYSFPSKLLQDKIKKLYDTSVQDESFETYGGVGCKYFNNRYYYSYGGGSLYRVYNIRKYEDDSYNEDYLYITDKYLYIKEGILESNNPDLFEREVYDSSDKTNLIEKVNTELVDTSTEEQSKEYEEKLLNKYEDKAKKYKHTFKKNQNDTYYWISSEPIE